MAYDKTTINVPPDENGPLYELAAALGFKRAGNGNLTKLCRHLIALVQTEGAEAVAQRLTRHPAAPAAGRQDESEEGDEVG